MNAIHKALLPFTSSSYVCAAVPSSVTCADGPVESTEVKRHLVGYRIGEKTMNEVKKDLGIKPFRKMRVWYWALPGEDHGKTR